MSDRPPAASPSLVVAGVLGATAVAAGAFGAHALRASLTAAELTTWKTAASYHLIHAVVLVALALQPARPAPVRAAGVSFTVGIVLFSGSLYAIVLTGVRGLGAITPLGGLALIAGWLLLAAAGVRRSADRGDGTR